MFAIVDIAGQQFKVEKGKSYFVHRLPNETETNVSFDKVLLLYNESDIRVGTPLLDGITIDAKVLEHLKGEKVIVFKKKRRKGYRVKNGHRQCFTKILVEDIILGEATPKKKAAEKKAVVIEEQPAEVETAMEAVLVEEVAPKKKAAEKKAVVIEEQPAEVETAMEAVSVDEVAPKKKAATRKPAAKKATTDEQTVENID